MLRKLFLAASIFVTKMVVFLVPVFVLGSCAGGIPVNTFFFFFWGTLFSRKIILSTLVLFIVIRCRARTLQCTRASHSWRTSWWPWRKFGWSTRRGLPVLPSEKCPSSRTSSTPILVRILSLIYFYLIFLVASWMRNKFLRECCIHDTGIVLKIPLYFR